VENRAAHRKATLYHSELLDPNTAEVIGHVVDVSSIGIRLVCPEAMQLQADVELLVKLPSSVRGKNEHQFTGSVRWCKPDINTDYFAVGIMIDESDTETQNILAHIHQLYCFSE
jgi:PilZ domain